eukprot:scaffold2910_cov390-Prasinococcus_capsulatus_cf.AAC.3
MATRSAASRAHKTWGLPKALAVLVKVKKMGWFAWPCAAPCDLALACNATHPNDNLKGGVYIAVHNLSTVDILVP